ncbi:hypothetical protein [Desulfosarcina cetonica]|uniref:hypothetical protein n=1 Tax=Desulfosarcina cetonica TaxID=90730 RepID=UPI0012ED8106|nr:hypothetical protein [Desulfosarcina cetonica]
MAFSLGRCTRLTGCLSAAAQSDADRKGHFAAQAARYAQRYSRRRYRQALLESLSAA